LQSIAVTECRMAAAFERTGMCLQRVTETDCNSSIGLTPKRHSLSSASLSTCHA